MGAALASAWLDRGHEVVIVSGPVAVDYPRGATVIPVLTTREMLAAAAVQFETCDGAIGAAAPCDYEPRHVSEEKIAKTGAPITIELIETADVVATLGQSKRADQWVVGFALETNDRRFRAIVKLEKKHCDLMVSNGPEAIDSNRNHVELLDRDGELIATIQGSKDDVARKLVDHFIERLLPPHRSPARLSTSPRSSTNHD